MDILGGLRRWANGEKQEEQQQEEVSSNRTPNSIFSTELQHDKKILKRAIETMIKNYEAPNFINESGETVAMDSIAEDAGMTNKAAFNQQRGIPDAIFSWYLSQGFIGYQSCGLISQNWLVDKACRVPGEDAVSHGFEINFPEGEEDTDDLLVALRETDDKFHVSSNLIEYEKMNRVFGIRLLLFSVKSLDPKYYENPFNIDGVKKGTYMGMSQIDPQWVSPVLTESGVGDPSSINFYEPEYWQVSGKKIHKSHFAIVRYSEVPDILKPTYQYGGLPLTQLIYERIYAAERTANEAPLLAMTKRTTGLKVDMEAALANQKEFDKNIAEWVEYRDNQGIKLMGKDEDMVQMDTSLADLDNVIMTQFQLVSAIANVPAVRLLGTTPKGFNSTGEFESKTYHEELKQIQKNDLTPVLKKHYQLVLKSKFEKKIPFDVYWNPTDAPTETEKSTIEMNKSQTVRNYTDAGVVSTQEAREKLAKDKESGWNDLEVGDDFDDFDDGDDDLIGADEDINLGYVSVRPRRTDQERLFDLVNYSAGVRDGIEIGKFHVTLMYSPNTTAMSVGKDALSTEPLVAYPTGEIRVLGEGSSRAAVMMLKSDDLERRHAELKALGMEHSFDDYLPHISLKYEPTDEDVEKLQNFIMSEEFKNRWNRIDFMILDDERWNPTKNG